MEKKWLVIILVLVSWFLGCKQRPGLSEPRSDGNLKSSPAHGQPGDHIRSGFYERARSAFAKVEDLDLTIEEARALFEELLTLANDVENAALVNHTMSFTSEQKRRFFQVRDSLGWANVAIGNNNLDVAIAYLEAAAGDLVEVLKKEPVPSDGPPAGDISEDPRIRSNFYERARRAFAQVEDLDLTMEEARALFEELLTLANDVEMASRARTIRLTSEQQRRFSEVRRSLGQASVALDRNDLDVAIVYLEAAAGELVEVLKEEPEPSDGPPAGDISEDPRIRSNFYERARSAFAQVEDLNLTMAEARALFEELLTLANEVETAFRTRTIRLTSEQQRRFFEVRRSLGQASVALDRNNLDVAIAYLESAAGELVEILKTE